MDDALARIDAANAEDPNTELVDGTPQPKELVYAQRMSAWLERLRPDAPETLRIAVRGQHLRRWDVPRDSYPRDRIGYLKWRKGLYKYHAEQTAACMRAAGYDEEAIARVQFLIEKKRLGDDPDTQTLEDCACLTFLQHHFAEFSGRTDREKMVGILRKTWKKMSPQAQQAALSLELPEGAQALLEEALHGGE